MPAFDLRLSSVSPASVGVSFGALATPKLASDADLKDLEKVMDSIDDMDDGEAEDDEIESEEDKTKREADEKMKRDKAAKDKARDAAKDKAAKDKARDAAESEEDRKKREEDAARDAEMEEKRKGEDERKEEERAARDQAMDAAISTAEKRITDRMKSAAEAREIVRPIVGAVSLSMDSAEDIYSFALKSNGIDTKGVHPSALRAMVGMLPKPGAAQPRLAQDAANASATLEAKFPALSRISQS